MANRLMAGRSFSHERERKVVNARLTFGTGTVTLDGPNSIGVLSVTRQSAGVFTFQFGFNGGGQNVVEGYVKLLGVETLPDVSYIAGSAPAAVGQPALLRNDLDSGVNLPAPTGGAAAAVGSGGTFTAGTYFWKVTAVDNKQNESLASAEFQQTLALNGSATLTWNAVPGAVGYRVYRGSATGAENVVYTVSGNAGAFTDTNAASQASAANQIQAAKGTRIAAMIAPAISGEERARRRRRGIAERKASPRRAPRARGRSERGAALPSPAGGRRDRIAGKRAGEAGGTGRDLRRSASGAGKTARPRFRTNDLSSSRPFRIQRSIVDRGLPRQMAISRRESLSTR